jgi:hypothetical protein
MLGLTTLLFHAVDNRHLTYAPDLDQNWPIVHRLAAIILIAGFVALASGALEQVHLRQHLLEHANAKAMGSGHSDRSENDCEFCVQLHAPALSGGWVPLLVCLGLLVAFLTLLAPAMTPQRIALRIDCRGPPVL